MADYEKNKAQIVRQTMDHIERVQNLLKRFRVMLETRGLEHDHHKLGPEELPYFIEFTPKLAGLTYGSEEYMQCLAGLKPALDHHYENSRHHPEFHEHGITDMTLIDLVEMLCDWKAASERHNDGDMQQSLDFNAGRFNIPAALHAVLVNTARDLGWV